MDNVPGPGFTDRPSSRLRDREGLAYTLRTNIPDAASTEPGYFGTDNPNFARVKTEILQEINRLRDEKPTANEVEDAKGANPSLNIRHTPINSVEVSFGECWNRSGKATRRQFRYRPRRTAEI